MAHDLRLPATIVGPADLARAKRNLDSHDELQRQADLRAQSTGAAETLHAGRVVSELSVLNELDLADPKQRTELLTLLEAAVQHAPVVTMSFAVDPSAEFMAKIVDWLRSSLHPQLLVRIGLQPSIAAGFTMRTSNKIYDFSLRQRLIAQRPLLIEKLNQTPDVMPAPAAVQPTTEAPATEVSAPVAAAAPPPVAPVQESPTPPVAVVEAETVPS